MGMPPSDEPATAGPCHEPRPGVDVCQPRVRTGLLVVSDSARARELAQLAAARLRIACTQFERVGDAADHLARTRASCVLLDVSAEGLDPMSALALFKVARAETPIVVLGGDGSSAIALAAVQAGAQDFLVADEVDEGSLERSIRYAIDRKRTEVQLAHLALHDHLTGLPNRSVFDDRLAHALRRRLDEQGGVAVLFVDIDGFKRINDTFGHGAGDEVLREAATRIRAAIRPHDTVARLGGDEFTILCEGVHGEQGALTIGRRVSDELGQPLVVDGHEIVLRASVGVSLAECEGVSAETLLQQSDDAMYRAKACGGGCPRMYAPGHARGRAGQEIQLESALRRAIPGELIAHYQPVVALDTGRLIGAEALVRWQHPTRGLVPPGEFIPVAEQSGLVVPLGSWMLSEACRQAVGWDDLRVSVNVSGRQVAEGSLVGSVTRALEESGLDPARLQLELTETVLMDDIDGHVALMSELKGLGVSLALDDFGKGYSSLSYLHRFPVDRIKIDRAFVGGLPDSRADLAIVSAVVSFARALDMEVVAEGVETQAHVDALREIGCEYAQGFFFHRPLAPERIQALIG
jgi:diguanylate cyclase